MKVLVLVAKKEEFNQWGNNYNQVDEFTRQKDLGNERRIILICGDDIKWDAPNIADLVRTKVDCQQDSVVVLIHYAGLASAVRQQLQGQCIVREYSTTLTSYPLVRSVATSSSDADEFNKLWIWATDLYSMMYKFLIPLAAKVLEDPQNRPVRQPSELISENAHDAWNMFWQSLGKQTENQTEAEQILDSLLNSQLTLEEACRALRDSMLRELCEKLP